MEYRSLYALGKEKLAAAGVPEADLDARLLLEYVCHTSRNEEIVAASCQTNQFIGNSGNYRKQCNTHQYTHEYGFNTYKEQQYNSYNHNKQHKAGTTTFMLF